MGEQIAEILSHFKSLILVVCVLLVSVAILGVIPTGSRPGSVIVLTSVQRFLFVALAGAVVGGTALQAHLAQRQSRKPERNPEYIRRFRETQEELGDIVPERVILAEADVGDARLVVLNDDMLTARTDILVSSDDNYLQAKGGVAKAILDKAGSVVEAELARRRRHPLRQGDIAVTGGGLTGARAILHPAIIDLDQSRYPNQSLIRKVVRRSLSCAVALGAGSIAFPVLGGGTASKYLEPWESIQAIVGETLDHVRGSDTRTMGGLIYIALYVYDPKDIKGDINALIEGALSGGTD